MVFKTGAFQLSPDMTPDQVQRKRAMIAALLPKFGSAKYVGEGIGQLATGVMAGRQGRKLDEIEGKGTASANSLWERLMGTANSAQSPDMGPLTVLGMKPEGPAMPPPDPTSPHALGDDAMAALGKPAMKTAADPASIKAGLVARGLPEHVAEGFVMNFQDESGLNPGINEAAPTVPGSRGGFGLYQLTGPRRRAYEAYAAERGVPLDDVDAQLDFMMMELQGPEAAAWSKISGTQNAGEAGAAIVNSFLRPAEEHRASRAAEYLGGGGGTTAAPAPTSAPSIPINELYMALQNPWLSGEQKGLITSMIQEQQQASDPLRQLQIAQAEAELAKTNAPAAPPEELTTRMMLAKEANLEPGTPEYQTYLLTGKLPEQAGSNVPAGVQELQWRAEQAGLVPGTPEYQSFIINGGGDPATYRALEMQAINAGLVKGTPEFQEFMATRGAGQAAYAGQSGTNAANIDSGGAAAGAIAAGKIEGENEANSAATIDADLAQADEAMALIDSVVNDPALASITGMVQGNLPPLTQGGVDLNVKIQQLQGKAFLEAFESLKGGGAISEREGTAATAAMARLDRAQSTEEYQAALLELKDILAKGVERARVKAGKAPAPAKPDVVPEAGLPIGDDGWTTLPNGVKVRVKP